MTTSTPLATIAVALILCSCMVPVSATLLEVTVKGQVATVNPVKNTLTIKNPEQYGCQYPASANPVCNWAPLPGKSSLTGTVPDPAAFSVFFGGELAVATSLGGAGEQWITLAKIYGPRETEQEITDIVGDPRTVPLPLAGDYSVEAETIPDCDACTGTTCTARQSNVVVKSAGITVGERTLVPGESYTYNGRNDGSEVTVKFLKGEAAAQACPGKGGMTGPQAISVYVISVTPPVGTGQVNIRTATTTRPDEALTTLPPTAVSTTTGTAPTKTGSALPVAALGALAAAVLILARR